MDPLAEAFDNISPYVYGMNNPILMIDPTGMAADSVAGSVVGPIIDVWGKVTSTVMGALTKSTTLEFPKFRLPGPPNPFILITGLFLLPSNYFEPKRNPDEMEWYRNNRHLLTKGTKTVEDLKKKYKFDKKTGGKGGEGTDIYEAEGGYDQANKDFDDVAVPGSDKPISGGGVGRTADGKTINVRDHSSADKPTLEIFNPSNKHKETKFRYK